MPRPPKKKAKQDPFPFAKLPEALLAKVFSYLPPKQRFQISAVCKQWLNVCRISWSDVSHLNASFIPDSKIPKILSLCPKIIDFVAHERTLPLDNPSNLFGSNLRSLRLYNVDLSYSRRSNTARYRGRLDRLAVEFFAGLPNLEELVWYLVYAIEKVRDAHGFYEWNRDLEVPVSSVMVASLRRLKIFSSISYHASAPDITPALKQLVNLECLHLEGIFKTGSNPEMKPEEAAGMFWDAFASLTKLKELCIAQVTLLYIYGEPIALKTLSRYACEHLPQLEVLFYASQQSIDAGGIAQLVTSHPALRILVLAGDDDDLYDQAVPFVVPPRKIRSRAGSTGSSVSSTLQVFVGGYIVHNILFTLPEANTTKFWLIDCEMPQFLAKPEVAAVFDGVWLAKMIREAVDVGQMHWVWGFRWESNYFFTPAPRGGLRSRTAALDKYWPEAKLRKGHH